MRDLKKELLLNFPRTSEVPGPRSVAAVHRLSNWKKKITAAVVDAEVNCCVVNLKAVILVSTFIVLVMLQYLKALGYAPFTLTPTILSS